MADHQDAAGEFKEGVFQRPQGVHVQSFEGSSRSRTFAFDFSVLARWRRLRSPPERAPTFFCWSCPEKLNRAQ